MKRFYTRAFITGIDGAIEIIQGPDVIAEDIAEAKEFANMHHPDFKVIGEVKDTQDEKVPD